MKLTELQEHRDRFLKAFVYGYQIGLSDEYVRKFEAYGTVTKGVRGSAEHLLALAEHAIEVEVGGVEPTLPPPPVVEIKDVQKTPITPVVVVVPASEVQTEEVQTEEVQTEEVQTEEVKTEEVKTEEVKTEEVQTEEVKTEGASEKAPQAKSGKKKR